MQVNSRDKHDFRGSDDLSCRANCSDYIVCLFLMMPSRCVLWEDEGKNP
jgi:hypothetical protein